MTWLHIENKTALITGGALGIGRAIADGLAAVGVRVVIADMNEEAGAAAVGELEQAGYEALFVRCN
ncbi:MAG: SDR family NAD(P)-dependent oxidoreductase, partial [Planctomycetota bacterium]